jgi:hypothetical protein
VKKVKRGTKWRIRFDAFSNVGNATYQNEVLEMRPNFLPEIFANLSRFKLYPSAIIGDITQDFLQLFLHKVARVLTRFFWYRITTEGEERYQDEVKLIVLSDSVFD